MLEHDHQISMTREAPYRYLNYATSRNWLRFVPPTHFELAEKILRRFPFLKNAEIVEGQSTDGVMERAAEMVYQLIQSEVRGGKDTVRIGFAGGRSMALLARKLNARLEQLCEQLPQQLICHNLVAGFSLHDPKSNPVSFLSFLKGKKASGLEVDCVIFQAPAIVNLAQRDQLLALPGIRNAREHVKDLNIIVTSGGSFEDADSMLPRYYADHKETIALLKEKQCEGDMLWLPICRQQPFRFDTLSEAEQEQVTARSMGLLELNEFPGLIQNGTHVVLALGPCLGCFKDKSQVLRAVLGQGVPLITHLVADTQTTRKTLAA
jgi:DNA-binding transcriptional regulator LsrR (DeoR family)